MCGIVGYVGNEQAAPILLTVLQSLNIEGTIRQVLQFVTAISTLRLLRRREGLRH